MRIFLTLILVLQVFRASGQVDSVLLLTLDETLVLARRNNPDLTTVAEQKKLGRNITSAWYKWLFQINASRLLQEHLVLLADLERIATLRYQQGDIDLVEKSRLLAKQAEIRTNKLVLTNMTDMTCNLLQQLLHYPGQISPADSGLSIYQIKKEPVADRRTPESLANPDQENLQLELDNCFIRLQYYSTTGLDHARLVHSISRSKFEAEETDYLEYARAIAEAFHIEMEYLVTLDHYNQTAIELEHHVY